MEWNQTPNKKQEMESSSFWGSDLYSRDLFTTKIVVVPYENAILSCQYRELTSLLTPLMPV